MSNSPVHHEESKLSDQDQKLLLLLEQVAAHCTADSEFEDLRNVHAGLQNGDRLTGKVLSGGYTNYSFKVYLENNPRVRLFAKVCFSRALWCPGDEAKHYDLERQTFEFNLMKRFVDEMGGPTKAPVVTPYLLLDVSEDTRILVAQWASADEQFANQFIDGHVDPRVLPRVAHALASINLAEVHDINMNRNMKENLNEMLDAPLDEEFSKLFALPKDFDPCISYLHEMGKERFDAIIDGMRSADNRKECMVHSDTHVFNLLVEGKPDLNDLSVFGPKGDLFICDWEMAHVGALGRDVGLLFSFPLACAYFHEAQGHTSSSLSILDGLHVIWREYASDLRLAGKNEEYVTKTFRSTLGFCGFVLYVIFYVVKKQIEFADTTGLSQAQSELAIAKMGITGLKFMEYAFVEDSLGATDDLGKMQSFYNDCILRDIDSMSEIKEINRERSSQLQAGKRRSSVLRTTGRRVSDAGMMESALGTSQPRGSECVLTLDK